MNTSHCQTLFYRSISLTLTRHQAPGRSCHSRQEGEMTLREEVSCLQTELDSGQVRIPGRACPTLLATFNGLPVQLNLDPERLAAFQRGSGVQALQIDSKV